MLKCDAKGMHGYLQDVEAVTDFGMKLLRNCQMVKLRERSGLARNEVVIVSDDSTFAGVDARGEAVQL